MVYSGRSGNLDVHLPRLEGKVAIHGSLDEPEWGQAAMLTGFSQLSPLDGIPASDSTEVLVWYSDDAIYFGIRAFEAHGQVHATLADRDKIDSDDFVQILLGTFNDGRQATVLAVNPLGVQSDGSLVETGSTSGNGFNNAVVRRELADLSPDFVFESKGKVTPYGYEVEVKVPFKSLRFQPAREQRWGINVTRRVQESGQEPCGPSAKWASASFSCPVRAPGGTDRPASRPRAGPQSVTHIEDDGRAGGEGWDYEAGSPSWAAPCAGGSPTIST